MDTLLITTNTNQVYLWMFDNPSKLALIYIGFEPDILALPWHDIFYFTWTHYKGKQSYQSRLKPFADYFFGLPTFVY